MTGDTSMRSNLAMYIQQSLECAGLISHGRAILEEISISQSRHSIDTTVIVLCVKSSAMEVTTEDSQPPSQSNPTSPNQSSSDSNQSISELSLPIYVGISGLIISSEVLVSW